MSGENNRVAAIVAELLGNPPGGLLPIDVAKLVSLGRILEKVRIIDWLRGKEAENLRPEQLATMIERSQHRSIEAEEQDDGASHD